MKGAGHGTRGERMMNRIRSEICRAAVLACSVSCNVMVRTGAIATKTAAAGRTRE
jgi:hypothetical protein